jgi:hypothetical protein
MNFMVSSPIMVSACLGCFKWANKFLSDNTNRDADGKVKEAKRKQEKKNFHSQATKQLETFFG